MELTSRKLEAALQLEGSFSANGLAAMSSDSSAQMALCKSLSERIDTEDIQRKWPKINVKAKQKAEPGCHWSAVSDFGPRCLVRGVRLLVRGVGPRCQTLFLVLTR